MKEVPHPITDDSHTGARTQLEIDCWFSVVFAYMECTRRYGEMLSHFELSIAQYDALQAIAILGGAAKPSEIAERLVVSKANITGLLRRLEQRSLVTLKVHPVDARALTCTLTGAGETVTRQAQAAASRFIKAQLQPFNNDALQNTAEMMRAMRSHLQGLNPAILAQGDEESADLPAQETIL